MKIMRHSVGLLFVCVCALFAQSTDPAVSRAQAELERIQALVDAGAAPRTQLERAERAMMDARDQALLRRTLYGEDLTEDLLGEMIAAAERRLERRKEELANAQRLVAEGVASQPLWAPIWRSWTGHRKSTIWQSPAPGSAASLPR